jgi:hypothetical protein
MYFEFEDYKPDITYATVAGEELKFDLATPKGLDHAVPAIVAIHGGGWMGGKRQDMTFFAKDAAARGYVAASISYRFAPKHVFPAQVEDAKCAVRWLRSVAKERQLFVDWTRELVQAVVDLVVRGGHRGPSRCRDPLRRARPPAQRQGLHHAGPRRRRRSPVRHRQGGLSRGDVVVAVRRVNPNGRETST